MFYFATTSEEVLRFACFHIQFKELQQTLETLQQLLINPIIDKYQLSSKSSAFPKLSYNKINELAKTYDNFGNVRVF